MLLFGCMDACVYVYACLCRCVYACRSECMCVCSCVRLCVSQVQGHSDLRALRSGLSCLEYSQADVYLQAHAPSHQVKRPLSLPHVQPSPPLFLTSSFYSLLFSSSCLHVSILFFSLYYTINLLPTCSFWILLESGRPHLNFLAFQNCFFMALSLFQHQVLNLAVVP